MEKDQRAKDIEHSQLAEIRKNLDDEYRIVETATYERFNVRYLKQSCGAQSKGDQVDEEITDACCRRLVPNPYAR